jgi:hypothetical protein
MIVLVIPKWLVSTDGRGRNKSRGFCERLLTAVSMRLSHALERWTDLNASS